MERSSTPLKHCSIMFYPFGLFGLHESSSLYVTSLSLSISLGFPILSAFKLFLGPRPPRPHNFIRESFGKLPSWDRWECVGAWRRDFRSRCTAQSAASRWRALRKESHDMPLFSAQSLSWGQCGEPCLGDGCGLRSRVLGLADVNWIFDQVVVPADDMGLAWIRRTYPKMHTCPCHVPSEKG